MIEAATVGMLVSLGLAAAGSFRGGAGRRLVAAELAGVIAVQLALLLSLQRGVPYMADVALLLALASFIGSLLFARFLERWL